MTVQREQRLFILKPTNKCLSKTEFDRFWQLYPRRVSRKAAEKAWLKIGAEQNRDLFVEIIKGLRRSIVYWQQKGTAPEFIPHASTWLNQERWTDELGVTIDDVAAAAKCPKCQGRGWTQKIDPVRGCVMIFCGCDTGQKRRAEIKPGTDSRQPPEPWRKKGSGTSPVPTTTKKEPLMDE